MAYLKELNRDKLPLHCNVVLLSPHSDDIALSLGAFLHGNCKAWHIQIITVFSISESTADDSIKNPSVVSAIRKAEDGNFIESLGRNVEVVWLDRRDAPLRLNISDKEVFNSEPSILDLFEVQNIMTKVKMKYGNCDLLLAPMAIGKHIDHIVVRNAAIGLLKQDFPVAFYEDLPYAADSSLAKLDEYSRLLGSMTEQQLEMFAIETGVTIEEKITLLSCYRSQMDSSIENRVRFHSNRYCQDLTVERVLASKKALPVIQHLLKGTKS